MFTYGCALTLTSTISVCIKLLFFVSLCIKLTVVFLLMDVFLNYMFLLMVVLEMELLFFKSLCIELLL